MTLLITFLKSQKICSYTGYALWTIRPIKKGICFRLTGWGKEISPRRLQKDFFCQKLSKSLIYILIKQLYEIYLLFSNNHSVYLLLFFIAVKITINTDTHCIFPIYDIIHVGSPLKLKILSLDKNFGRVIEKKSHPAGTTETNIFFWLASATNVSANRLEQGRYLLPAVTTVL